MVGTARRGVDETASDTRDEKGVVDLKLDRVVELVAAFCEHRVEAVGLGDCSGEAVEDEATRYEEVAVSSLTMVARRNCGCG